MGYISDMRKLVGRRTIIQCAASIIVIDKDGRLLLGKRTDNGMWGYSGGSIEIDEKAEECARRELYEEMGIFADSLELFCINSGPEAHYIYPNGDEVSNVEIIYLCKEYHGDLSNSDEMTDLQFFEPEKIDLETISPPIRNVIERYIDSFAKP